MVLVSLVFEKLNGHFEIYAGYLRKLSSYFGGISAMGEYFKINFTEIYFFSQHRFKSRSTNEHCLDIKSKGIKKITNLLRQKTKDLNFKFRYFLFV